MYKISLKILVCYSQLPSIGDRLLTSKYVGLSRYFSLNINYLIGFKKHQHNIKENMEHDPDIISCNIKLP